LGVIPLYFTKNISFSTMSLASALAGGLLPAACHKTSPGSIGIALTIGVVLMMAFKLFIS